MRRLTEPSALHSKFSSASLLLLISLVACTPSYQVAKQDIRTYQVRTKGQEKSAELEALLAPFRGELEQEMNEEIAAIAIPLSKTRPESTMGNLVADALLQYCQGHIKPPVDFATLNHGGVRISSLGAGPLVVGKVYELMPFDNMLTILDLTGPDLLRLLEAIANDGGWPISRGITFVIENREPREILIKGEQLDLNQTYRVALPDFIADGGSGCGFLRDLPRVSIEPILIRDILLQELKIMGENGPLQSKIEGRIVRATE